MSFFVFFQLLGGMVGAIIGIIVSHFFTVKRDKKILRHDDIEIFCNQIETTKEEALIYWSGKTSNELNEAASEAKIIGQLHGLVVIVDALKTNSNVTNQNIDSASFNFRQACTSGQFGQKNRKFSKERIKRIEVEASVFLAEMRIHRWR